MLRAVLLSGLVLACAAAPCTPTLAAPRKAKRTPRRAVAAPSVRHSASSNPQQVKVTGRILHPDGTPAPEARVYTGTISPRGEFRVVSAPVDAAAKFTALVSISSTQSSRVAISALVPGKSFAWQVLPVNGAQVQCGSVRLTPGTTLQGRLIRTTGEPVAGVSVSLAGLVRGFRTGDDVGSFSFVGPSAHFVPPAVVEKFFQARTDAKGVFSIVGLPRRGDAELKVASPLLLGPGSTYPVALQSSDVTPAGILVAAQAGAMRIHVTDVSTGKPVPQMLVVVDSPLLRNRPAQSFLSPPASLPATTDALGNITIGPLLPGAYEVWLQGGRSAVTVEEGKPGSPLEFKARTETLAGQVVDAAGKPQSQVAVQIVLASDTPRAISPNHFGEVPNTVQTDALGRFHAPEFPWGATQVTLRAVRGNEEAVWTGAPDQFRAASRLVLKRNARVTVRGRLLHPDRTPVTDRAMQVVRWQEGPRASWLANARATGIGDDGKFEIEGMQRGEAFSLLSQSSFDSEQRAFESPRFTTSESGAVQDLGDVIVHPLEGGSQQLFQIYGLDSPGDLARLVGLMKDPSASDVAEAREALRRYGDAARAGNLNALHGLTSPASLGWSEKREEFLLGSPIAAPLEPGSEAELQPLRKVPLISAVYLNALHTFVQNSSNGLNLSGSAREVQEHPNWVFFVRPDDAGMEVAGILHKEDNGWKIVNLTNSPQVTSTLLSLGGVPGSVSTRAVRDQPAVLPSAEKLEAARATAEQYLTAWWEGRDATRMTLTSPLSFDAVRDLGSFARVQRRRVDEGACPVSAAGHLKLEPLADLKRWEAERLVSYAGLIGSFSNATRARNPASVGDRAGFPAQYVERAGAVVFRYPAGDHFCLMVLLEHDGKWKVLEPALPAE